LVDGVCNTQVRQDLKAGLTGLLWCAQMFEALGGGRAPGGAPAGQAPLTVHFGVAEDQGEFLCLHTLLCRCRTSCSAGLLAQGLVPNTFDWGLVCTLSQPLPVWQVGGRAWRTGTPLSLRCA